MKTILITRPLASATVLAEKIRAVGAWPLIFPTIDIKKLKHTIDFTVDMIIFISPTAVDCMDMIPESPQLFAVGKDTALKIGRPVIYPEIAGADALLALPSLHAVRNKKILICQGVGGNAVLKETLLQRGAQVTQAFLYERVLPTPSVLPDLRKIDMIIVTSGESLKNLILLLGPGVLEKKLLVSSERLKALAKTVGFKLSPLLAKQATDEAILTALKLHL